AAAGFPDALVGLVPVGAQPVDHVRGGGPALIGGLQAAGVDLGDRVQRLAVDVQLELVGGPVPDPHRPGAAPAFEMVERLFAQVGAPVDPVHDLHRTGAVAAVLDQPVADPLAEGGGLPQITEPDQRVYGERGVPDPGVAVVPIPFAPSQFGQPGGGRSD